MHLFIGIVCRWYFSDVLIVQVVCLSMSNCFLFILHLLCQLSFNIKPNYSELITYSVYDAI